MEETTKKYTTEKEKRKQVINLIEKRIIKDKLNGNLLSAKQLAIDIYERLPFIIKN